MCQDCTHFDYHIICCITINKSTRIFNWDKIKMQPLQKKNDEEKDYI